MVEGPPVTGAQPRGQTMMGDSGREHVRCSKADWCEKRERRIIPSPQTQNGNKGEVWAQQRSDVVAIVTHNPMLFTMPSGWAQVSPFPHPSSPVEGAQSPGLGRKTPFTSTVPISKWRPLEQRSCFQYNMPSMPGRALAVTKSPCLSISKAGSQALQE